jgi:porphobilinogen synthase
MERLRRLRTTPARRRLFREIDVPPRCLVPAYFVVPGSGVMLEQPERGGTWRLSVDRVRQEAERAREGGAAAIMLFGVPAEKGIAGAKDANSLVAQAVRALDGIDLVTMVDVCLCSYTHDGHCGVWHGDGIDNDGTLPHLVDMAVALADSGADIVCPSDMMDGRVGEIRAALDARGHAYTMVMAYAAKMASAFYGPFRLAADSAPAHGDRRGYQLPPSNRREALREIAADAAEGADLLMIKPALSNLDLIRECRERWDLPIVAYQVSGEYAMLREAAAAGRLDYARAALESLQSIRRAGADLVVTYLAREAWSGGIALS